MAGQPRRWCAALRAEAQGLGEVQGTGALVVNEENLSAVPGA